MYKTQTLMLASVLLSISTHSAVAATTGHENTDISKDIEEVVVYGRAHQQIGNANTASEGSVGGADLAIRPLLQVAELLESVPGMVAVQHSGSGKANQYFLRGFNLDHGTDFTNSVDGVPLNIPSHGHGQGYLDVNGIIPDIIERIIYRKGTYNASSGDFSIAGSSAMQTIDRLDSNFISTEVGSNAWRRTAAGISTSIAGGEVTVVIEAKHYDGPWELAEDLEHKSLWTQYRRDTKLGQLSASISGYSAQWQPTEQIPESVIGSSVCENQYCTLEPSANGKTDRWIATVSLQQDSWSHLGYVQKYDWKMSSNPSYDQQINQFDERIIVGGQHEYHHGISNNIEARAGLQYRYDHADRVGVDFFEQGLFTAPNGDNQVKQGSVALYASAKWQASTQLRFEPGVRVDYYHFDVNALNTLSVAGTDSDTIVSPKLNIAYQISSLLEAYANWGYGFHSNDARGVVDEDNGVEGLVRGQGREIGARVELDSFKISAAYWWLAIDSELVFVGDSNSVEPKGGSKRKGFELTAFWTPTDWLAIDASYAQSDAFFTNAEQAGGRHIDGSVEDSGSLGITVNYGAWDVNTRVRYLGEYALIPDNSARAGAITTMNLRAAREFKHFSAYAEVLNLTDKDGKDIVYFYETNVTGFGESLGRVSRQREPRTYRLGVRFSF